MESVSGDVTEVTGRLLRRPRDRTSLGLAVFFLFYLFIGVTRGEAFPFSTFPMYSTARLDPYVVPTQQVYAYDQAGREYAVANQSIRGRVRAVRTEILEGEIDDDAVTDVADELVRSINARRLTPQPAVGVRVMDQQVQLRPRGSGDPLDPDVVSAELLIDTAPPNARFSADAHPTGAAAGWP